VVLDRLFMVSENMGAPAMTTVSAVSASISHRASCRLVVAIGALRFRAVRREWLLARLGSRELPWTVWALTQRATMLQSMRLKRL